MPDFKILSRSSGFSVMNNDIFRDLELSHSAMGLLCKMLSLPPEWDYSIRGLVAISKDGRDAITKQLKELENLGYITRTQTRNASGKMGKMTYIVRDFKVNTADFHILNDEILQNQPCTEKPCTEKPCTEKPCTEKPDTVKPDTEKPYPVNPPQLNTNELNTNELNTNELNTNSLSNDKKIFVEKFKALFGRVPDKSLLRIVGQVPPEDVETALSIAAKKKLDNPAAYITAILTKMQQPEQHEAPRPDEEPAHVQAPDAQAPLADWEKQWLEEMKRRKAERESI